MSMLIYVDTNVYLDFLVDGRPKDFTEDAFQLFYRALQCEFEIIISRKIKTELRPNIQGKESSFLFNLLEPKLRLVDVSAEDIEEAKALDSIDTADALHAILARKFGAELIITQNMKHFLKFSGVIKPARPSEL